MDLTIFMILYLSSLEIINVVIRDANSEWRPDLNIFLWIAASVADAFAVNPNGIKTLLANGLNAFPIKGNPDFSNCPKSLPRNTLDSPILCNWIFDNFILADEPFSKL